MEYTFGFGDWDEVTGDINDSVVSNNGDADKILATVAGIIYDFTGNFFNANIFIKGATTSRTRLYQMSINKYWDEISEIFMVLGYRNNEWEPFEKNQNYEAFLATRWA